MAHVMKTDIGERNVVVQSRKAVIWLEVENADDTTTCLALTPEDARTIARALSTHVMFAEVEIELAAHDMLDGG